MSFIQVLGSSGSKSQGIGTTSFKIYRDVLIDSGNVINSLGAKSCEINHIFLTHSHLDHITDIPFLLDNCFSKREKPLKVYGSFYTIKNLENNIFNNAIWPDFSKIKLKNGTEDILQFQVLEAYESVNIDELQVTPIKVNHTEGSFGFIVNVGEDCYFVSGDTLEDDNIVTALNENTKIKTLIIECSFPNSLQSLANASKHLTPNNLDNMLRKISKRDIKVFLYHLKNPYEDEIKTDLQSLNYLDKEIEILSDGDIIDINTSTRTHKAKDSEIFDRVMDINLKLSSEQDKSQLYEMILTLLRDLTNSDGGTLYLLSEDKKHLEFKVVQNRTLGIYLGTKEQKISWNALPLYLENGEKNRAMVAVVCALDNKNINISDVYNSDEYNFEGTKVFDKSKNYRSKSMLVVPLVNHEGDVIGVIQLINKYLNNKITHFSLYDEKVIKALSSQAAMALTNTQLIASLEHFLEAFVTAIANAVDAKSRHTSNHIRNMAKLAPLIAVSINDDKGIYKDINYSANDLKEIELAAKLHDVGKISIPEWVIDKSTKLQKLLDGFELIELRVEIIKRDLKINLLENKIHKEEYEKALEELQNDLEFIRRLNKGSEFTTDEDINKVNSLSFYKYNLGDKEESLLNKDEVYNLSVRKGTLTKEEKDIMNSHAKLSYDMLSSLPFPKKYSNVMHIAVNHHEKLNGKGYPRGLSSEDLCLEDRILILADIFEALTSIDRPYKGIKKLSEVFKILDFMAKDNEIDADLLNFFKNSDALKQYSKAQLLEEQLDV